MLADMRWSWTTAFLAFREIIQRALESFSLPPNTFYINSRSWHLFSRPSVKLSKNILEKPLSLHVDGTVPLNPWIMKDKMFSTAGSWLHRSLCLKTQISFPCFTEGRSENSKEKPRRWKKKKKRWKEALVKRAKAVREREWGKKQLENDNSVSCFEEKDFTFPETWETKSEHWAPFTALLSDTLQGELVSTERKEYKCSTNRNAYTGNVPAYTASACLALCRHPSEL